MHKWIQRGSKVFYLIGTNGDKGDDEGKYTPEQLAAIREKEQRHAAVVLGVEDVAILGRSDGSLAYSAELRGEVVRYIRKWKPDAVFTHDPTVFIQSHGGINHSDHRAIGAVALDAAYPYARGRLQYPEHIREGLEPHRVERLYVWGSDQQHWNYTENVTDHVDAKLTALFAHESQFPDREAMRSYTLEYMQEMGKPHGYKYGEAFRLVTFS